LNIKELVPPFLFNTLYNHPFRKSGWFGNFSSWQEASASCSGYDHADILKKVKDSLLKVKRGEAVHERDSVLFDAIEYTWPVLSGLLVAASRCGGLLNVIDFGGSLGSTYFQNRKFLSELAEVKWNIIEQESFVKTGQEYFQDNSLRFYLSISDCLRENQPNVVLLSSVLSYLPDPYKIFDEILSLKMDYIILDKMPFIEGTADRITIQKVPDWIYRASYPAWFFSEQKFKDFISSRYAVLEEFDSNSRANIPSRFKGLILKKL
jgi:putative methyltransferase (TIGR04325 family)